MLTSKNTVVFIHQRADQKIIKAICLDLLVLSMDLAWKKLLWVLDDVNSMACVFMAALDKNQ